MRPDYDRSAAEAAGLLIDRSICRLPVNPLALLIHTENVRVMTYMDLRQLNGLSPSDPLRLPKDGFTARHGSEYCVFYDEHVEVRERIRFTLAHELGHIILGHDRETDLEEAEANTFATHLLLPRMCLARMKGYGDPSIERIMRIFGVSWSVVDFLQYAKPTRIDPFLNHDIDDLLGWEIEYYQWHVQPEWDNTPAYLTDYLSGFSTPFPLRPIPDYLWPNYKPCEPELITEE